MKTKKWAISLVWTKNNSGTINIVNSLVTNIQAETKEEAFGKAYEKSLADNKEHQLFNYVVGEQL